MDRFDRALASCFSAEETCERSAVSLPAAPLVFCCAEDTACSSPEHELPLAPGELFSLAPEAAAAVSAAPAPAQSTASFARAAASVARWPARARVSVASVAETVTSIPSALASCWSACWTAEGAVPEGTRMLEEPA